MTDGDDAVTIESLDIIRAPGFETDGFALDEFSPGINLIHGPNGAGKTTTAKSIERVLWPETAEERERLVGQVSLNGDLWRVEAANGCAEYQQNGQESAAPTLPPAEQRDRYQLSLHDLLQQDTRDESFAETIERESAGGFDLAAAADELGYKDSAISRRQGVYQDAKAAVSSWREEQRDAKGLETERSRLTKLRSELEAAKRARDEKDALEQAITYREAKSTLDQAEATFESFPDILADLTGDELETVERLDAEIQSCTDEIETAKQQQEEAEAILEQTALPDDGVSDGTITELKKRQSAFEDHEDQRDRVQERLERAKAERRNAHADIPADIGHDALVNLDSGSWADVSEFARTALEVKAVRETQKAVNQWADGEETPEADRHALERGSSALVEWLASSQQPESSTGNSSVFYMGIVSGLVVLMTGVLLGVLVNPLLSGVSVVGLILLVYGYLNREVTAAAGDERTAHQKTFEQTGLDPPATWTEDTVRDRLIELYGALAHHTVVEERQEKRETLLADQDIEAKEQDLKQKRDLLRETVGAAPNTADISDIELAVFVERVLEWQDAHDDVLGAEAELEEVRGNLDTVQTALASELGKYGYSDIEDSAAAEAAIHELEQRKTKHERASSNLSAAKDAQAEAESKLDELKAKREVIFTSLDLVPGSHDELASLCEQVDGYEAAANEVAKAEAVVEQELQTLTQKPAYDPEYKDQPLSELQGSLRKTEAVAADHDEIQEEISTIEANIRAAKTDTAVEAALHEKEAALSDLEGQLHDDYSSMVGDVLIGQLQEKTVEANRPAVFQRANDLLATITHGRYELVLNEGEQTFRAYDTVNQKGLALDELSSGTRVQVLLAVRIAFVDQQEHGRKLPVVFDETLANTDDLRAGVIIDAMIKLCRDGRQIFYFTAQGDELAKWNKALERESEVEWTTINLADVQGMDREIQIPELDTVQGLAPDPPEPSDHDHDHDSYGTALDVPPVNPFEGAGTAHLWYVVDDVDVLHDLLDFGIERWGQLRNLLDRDRHDIIPAERDDIDRIEQTARALEEFVQSWRIGRGKPVDRAALESSGAVSDTFIDRVTELAKDLDGDAEALVEALHAGEVNRFRGGKADDLAAYLRENGYIVTQEPLSDDQIRLRMVERCVESGVSTEKANEQASTLLSRLSGQ